MKVLFVASVYRHLTAFHIPFMEYFQSEGYEIYAAGIGEEDRRILQDKNITCIDIPFSRSPLAGDNIKAYKALKTLFKDEKFDLVHVHTPVAAFLTRLAFRNVKHGKIIYTAHGFHFFKGAPLQNWLLYYPLEKVAAKWTDHLITINNEDYQNALKFLPKEQVSLVHGVGVEPNTIVMNDAEKKLLKQQLGLRDESIIISYVAELNDNKNHIFLFNNWEAIKKEVPNYELLVIGTGEKEEQLKQIVKERNLQDIHFLGFRRDVPKILKITDIVCLLSLREGLPKSILEAMSEHIASIVSNTRGLRDLIQENINGKVIYLDDNKMLYNAFVLMGNKEVRKKMGENTFEIVSVYFFEIVLQEYIAIYKEVGLNVSTKVLNKGSVKV